LAVLWRWRSRAARQATILVLILGFAVVALAGLRQMLKPGPALALEALALIGLGYFTARRGVSWGACAAVTFAALGLGVYHLQPAYNRQFALRGHLRSDADLAAIERLPVVCYPQRWDSVSFYLPHADVHVYTLEQRRQLLVDLRGRPRTLLVVKSGKVLEDLLRELPDSVEFVTRGRSGALTTGWVRDCRESPRTAYARR
jgi:hypothetical protein